MIALPPARSGALPAVVDAPWRENRFLLEDAARWEVARAWSTPSALLLDVCPHHGGCAVVGLGDPHTLAEWLGALALDADGPHPSRASLARGTWARLPEAARGTYGLAPFSSWDWLVTDVAPGPRGPGEERVVRLTSPAERTEAARVVALANPTTLMTPADAQTRWWGWRDDDGVLRGVVGGRRVGESGPLHLGGIGTDPAWRGRGIASAITAAVLREGLAEAPWVSLGVREANDRARSVYLRLGFRPAGRFETVRAGTS